MPLAVPRVSSEISSSNTVVAVIFRQFHSCKDMRTAHLLLYADQDDEAFEDHSAMSPPSLPVYHARASSSHPQQR
jgi:hypothetical protein